LSIFESFSLSGEGAAWLLTTALLLVVGVGKNINLLALLGYVMLALLLLNAAAAGRRLRLLEGQLRVEEMVFAGSGCKLEVRLHNLAGRTHPGFRLEDRGPAHALGWYVYQLGAHERRTFHAVVVLPRRGEYAFGPLTAVGGHPFGLVRPLRAVGPGSSVLVLPRPGKLSRDRLRHRLRGADPRGEHVQRRGWRHEAAQAEFHGLRPFRPGDSPRWVHWRTSARRGELMVREMEDVPGDDLLLVLDATGPAGELFEEAVTLAATIVWEWCRRRGDRLLLAVHGEAEGVSDGMTGAEHARRLLERLARVHPGPAGAGAAAGWARAVPRTAGVLVVSAGPTALDGVLEASLDRPVLLLDAALRAGWDFYTAPPT
jgi:uncharacterized protein (DUF58 family)